MAIMNPNMLISMLKPNQRHICDFSCFEMLYLGGSAVLQSLVDELKLVDPHTNEDVLEKENTPGELWIKESFSDDGWFRSGDILHRDENWKFFFVDQIKMLLKYRNHQISPVEIEDVIRGHPGVFEVAVTGVAHPEDGELPVACVIKQPGSNVTAKEIEDLVSESLTDTKRLRGGVIFMNKLPYTPTFKINRVKLKQIVCDSLKQQGN